MPVALITTVAIDGAPTSPPSDTRRRNLISTFDDARRPLRRSLQAHRAARRSSSWTIDA
jgi:hypothetical protein